MQQTRNGTGPKCPQIDKLRELADWCMSRQDECEPQDKPQIKLYADLYDALDWLATSLENRNLYHKKQQLKKKVLINLAREHGLLDEVNALTDSALHTFVSNQPPDKDDLNINFGDDNDKD
jgi:hypothetical protein